MSITLKDSDAQDVTFVLTSFSGSSAIGTDQASTSTFRRTLTFKHQVANEKVEGRHLLSIETRRFDATTGQWEVNTWNITNAGTAKGIITADDIADAFAMASNYFTKNAVALTAPADAELVKFTGGISPI